MPYYAPVLKALAAQQGNLHIVIIVAPSVTELSIRNALDQYHPQTWGCRISYVTTPQESLIARARSVCALTKPGTNTLELALLSVPGVVMYKTSWLTYWLARCVVNVSSMTLPNLLLGEVVYPEFIQGACQTEAIVAQLRTYLRAYEDATGAYKKVCAPLARVRDELLTNASPDSD